MSASNDAIVTLEVPGDLAEVLRPIVEQLTSFRGQAADGEPSFREAEAEVGRLFARAETQAVGSMLAALDPQSEYVEVEGREFRRMNLETGEKYHTIRGTVRVERALYREVGVRNGPTIVPMELRAGIVEGRYTPEAARAVATLAQALPSREADLVTEPLGVLPHSRSSQQRAGISVGSRARTASGDLVSAPIEVPEEAVSVSVAADRVSMPMAEPRELTREDVQAGVKRPIHVAFRMAFAGVLTLHNADGDPLLCLRHAHVPSAGRIALQQALAGDLDAVLSGRPDLTVVALSDGAPEMQGIVDDATQGHNVAARLTDFWHLTEHLAAALRDTDRYVPDVLGDWKRDLLARDDAIDTIETELRTWALEHPTDKLPQGLHDAITFIENRRDRLRYATARANGLPIGSGSVEATCKTVVQTRMKRPGSRWTEDGAQPILDLRALATSSPGRWNAALDSILNSYTKTVNQLSPARSING